MEKKKVITKTISLDNEVHKKIKALKTKMKRSYSGQVSFMLQEYLKEGEKNETDKTEEI